MNQTQKITALLLVAAVLTPVVGFVGYVILTFGA